MATLVASNAITIRVPAPRTPREWSLHVRIPAGMSLSDHAAHDAAAAAAAPPGWYCVGTIPISPRDRSRLDDPSAWSLRITYCPLAWRETATLVAPPAVYAAAQIAGLRTRLDSVLVADHYGIQYTSPDGRPTMRQSWWEGREQLPADVLRDLSRIDDIDRRRSHGYMRGRPDTGRAYLAASDEASSDATERTECCARIAAWIRAEHASVLGEAA